MECERRVNFRASWNNGIPRYAIVHTHTHRHHRCCSVLIINKDAGSWVLIVPSINMRQICLAIDLRINPLISCRYSPGSFVIGTKGKFEINSFFDKPATCHSPYRFKYLQNLWYKPRMIILWNISNFQEKEALNLAGKIFFKSVWYWIYVIN